MAGTANIIIYVMPGSQFSAKVLVSLDSRNIPHHVSFVDPRKEKRTLPSGGTMVPEMVCNEDIVPDSDQILRYIDKHLNTGFFPSYLPSVGEICERASTVLAAYALYYNWVYEPSYRRTMRTSTARYLPGFVCCCRDKLADWQLSPYRDEFQLKVAKLLGLDSSAELPDEPKMREMLAAELQRYQAELKSEQQLYLIATSTRLTAADAAVYAQLERLVGDEGDANLPCSLPELLDDGRLARLWKWHSYMRAQHPIKFKGKRPPKAQE